MQPHSIASTLPLLLVALAAAPIQAAGEGATGGVTGLWLDQPGKGAVDIEPCGDTLCGHITWLKAPLDASGRPKTDTHNAQASLQSRPICGLPVLWDFHPDGENAWSGGRIYDPEKGETYSSNFHLQPDGTLHVRGYLGISLLGRTEIWTRPTQPMVSCGVKGSTPQVRPAGR
jgi:uncharacterized protein (DUF2147 family)